MGRGFSSPVIVDGRVFVTDFKLDKPRAWERLLCFDERTGKPLWTHAYEVALPEWAFNPEHGGGPAPTPAVDSSRVFTVGANGHVHCLDVRSGRVVWERDLRKQYEIRDLQCRPSPLIEGKLLIVVTGAKPDACVLALDQRTGQTVWHALDDAVANSSPIAIDAGGKRQLIVWTDDAVTSLNPRDGSVWWREFMKTSNNDSIPTPVREGERLLVSGRMFRLDANTPTAKVLWPQSGSVKRRLLSNTSSPFVRNDHVYSANATGELLCLDARDGTTLWRTNSVTKPQSGAGIHITRTPNGWYLFTNEGNLISARLTPGGYEEISRTHLIDPTSPFFGKRFVWPPASFANGHVFVRNDKQLIRASLQPRSD